MPTATQKVEQAYGSGLDHARRVKFDAIWLGFSAAASGAPSRSPDSPEIPRDERSIATGQYINYQQAIRRGKGQRVHEGQSQRE